ncbi:MAG: acetylglutamate kinase [Planctomycetota bacterium]|nr:MAG: acetylglutamate kinase [Planctomycetota bacterium]
MLDLLQAAPHVRLQRGSTMVFKIGGACLARPRLLQHLAEQIAVIQAFGVQPVIVHGGGPQADLLQQTLGETPQKIDGRRITSKTALRAVQMSMLGDLNGALAAALTEAGARAIGLNVGTGNVVKARRRPPMETSLGEIDFGEVGDVEEIQPKPLHAILEAGCIPVVCPPVSDGKGGFLNVNADSLAASLAVALQADRLLFVTSVAGILHATDQTVISALGLEELRNLQAEGALVDGMSVKAKAMEVALLGGVDQIHVVSGIDSHALLIELYTNQGSGTLLTQSSPSLETSVDPSFAVFQAP